MDKSNEQLLLRGNASNTSLNNYSSIDENLVVGDDSTNSSNNKSNVNKNHNNRSSTLSNSSDPQEDDDDIIEEYDDDQQQILVFDQSSSNNNNNNALTINNIGNSESRAKKVRRHIIGAICVLIVVFLWVFSSILTQIIFTEESFDKPFFLTYFNTSIFSFYLFGFAIKWKKWTSIPISDNNGNRVLDTSVLQSSASMSLINDNDEDQLNAIDDHSGSIQSSSSLSPPLQPTSFRDSIDQMQNKQQIQVDINKSRLRNSNNSNTINNNINNKPHSLKSIIKISAILCPIWFAANYTYNISLDITSVSSNTILSSLSGVFSLFISIFLKVDKFSIEKLLSTLISLSGIVLVSYSDISSENGHDTVIGDLLAVVGAFLYGFYCTMIKKLVISEDLLPMPMMFGFVGLINLLILWPGFLILNAIGFETFELPNIRVFLFLLFNGVFGSFISDLIESYSVVLTSPVINTIGLSLSIPLAMISDFIRKGKMFGWMYIIGSILVVIGFLLANLASSLFEEKLKRIEKRLLSLIKRE
ncbi:hypothetical protein PPL_05142 [Heterostelium album PN500]|uniref:EamA domain-containing protein n=1 Tax=Heterostelium pallidum (strain ATCC 26659 / Pp 5 / PN500) TaxID=670386 RepID=D3B9J8_HETP5|nr:hypothetical protein PPL_05142 [Heterostelium album PN500]EFA81910.1 hypothetical protein PPL_05142 [Heterostelium album PN500]|eukprot:XP_020434027.1 hypothetical protein PPL_05142 [Heterostelium album PN500]